MRRNDELPQGILSVEAFMIGEHTARVSGWEKVGEEDSQFEFKLDIRKLEALRLHVDNAISYLYHRMITDAVCGNCTQCKNVRMINIPRSHGNGTELVNCPKCYPKILKARQKGLMA